MWDFFVSMFSKLNAVFISVRGKAVAGFILTLYGTVIGSAATVVYLLYEALDKNGMKDRFMNALKVDLAIVERVAQNCFPLLTSLSEFIQCAGNQ